MKKGLIAAALGCALVSVSSHADTIAGVYVGAQVWQTDTQGGFADRDRRLMSQVRKTCAE